MTAVGGCLFVTRFDASGVDGRRRSFGRVVCWRRIGARPTNVSRLAARGADVWTRSVNWSSRWAFRRRPSKPLPIGTGHGRRAFDRQRRSVRRSRDTPRKGSRMTESIDTAPPSPDHGGRHGFWPGCGSAGRGEAVQPQCVSVRSARPRRGPRLPARDDVFRRRPAGSLAAEIRDLPHDVGPFDRPVPGPDAAAHRHLVAAVVLLGSRAGTPIRVESPVLVSLAGALRANVMCSRCSSVRSQRSACTGSSGSSGPNWWLVAAGGLFPA